MVCSWIEIDRYDRKPAHSHLNLVRKLFFQKSRFNLVDHRGVQPHAPEHVIDCFFLGACEGLGTRTLCEDFGDSVGIVSELDVTAAKGILDRTGLAKVRHVDVNYLWLQEQCAKNFVQFVKIPGEHNLADLIIKHLILFMINRHIQSCDLEFTDGRLDKAAKLHSVTRNDRQESAALKLQTIDKSFASVSGGDYWHRLKLSSRKTTMIRP